MQKEKEPKIKNLKREEIDILSVIFNQLEIKGIIAKVSDLKTKYPWFEPMN